MALGTQNVRAAGESTSWNSSIFQTLTSQSTILVLPKLHIKITDNELLSESHTIYYNQYKELINVFTV